MKGLFQKLMGSGAATDYKSLLNQGATILDVRTVDEFQSGHIKGSKNIPLDQINNKLAELKKTGNPVITVCQSGGRSSMAKTILSNAGVEAYNGGGWSSFQKKI